MIRILTIDREYGSGAGEIAKRVTGQLGWKLWDELLTTEIARLMDCECRAVEEREERRDALHYRLFKAFLKGSFEGTLNASRARMVDADCIREAAETVVRRAAGEGHCVIVGRGSAYYLNGNPEAFHIFLYAPIEEKVRRLQLQGKSEDEAYSLAESIDRDRAAYIKQYFKVDWPFLHMYDLMINTAMGDDAVANMILDAVTRSQYVSRGVAR
ncbi:MAG TPA: cytidylate kinase-like family protein [Bryobacteraceae bacterium]|nr:cytidylate kinase-like family protein [Bryobacteraceae bacterium]